MMSMEIQIVRPRNQVCNINQISSFNLWNDFKRCNIYIFNRFLPCPIDMSTQQSNNRKAVKRAHNMAFEYEETEVEENGNNMQLPEGTECIVLDSDDGW